MVARRDVLRWGFGLGLIAASGAMLKGLLWPAPLEAGERRTLESLAASLLPEEGLAAPGLAMLAAQIAGRADADRALRRILRRGTRWLDEAADELRGRSFAALDAADRETLLQHASTAEAGSLPRVLFERLRLELFGLYYARAETVAALGLPSPPQPAGFPDYTRAP